LAQNTSTEHRLLTIHPPLRLVGELKKKERKEEKRHPKLAIRPDHPRRRIKIKLCLVGGLRCAVMCFKCHPNRSKGYGAVGVENGPSHYFGQWVIQQLVLPYKPS